MGVLNSLMNAVCTYSGGIKWKCGASECVTYECVTCECDM